MAPRHDRTPSGSFPSSTRLRSSYSHASDGTRPYHDLAPRGAVCELSSNESKMRPGAGSQVKRKKVSFTPAQVVNEASSSDNESMTPHQRESLMWKLKRIEAQAQARELRRKIQKQNQEIRIERRELRRLKTIEKELIEFLEACEQRELQQLQQLQQSQQSDLLKSSFSRIYMVIAAIVSCFLLRFVTYSSFVVNRH